jgi:hypothetical protein
VSRHPTQASTREHTGRPAAKPKAIEDEAAQAGLLATKRFACWRYGSYPNVLAVGVGTKFQRPTHGPGRPRRVAGVTAIQFFVSRKHPRLRRHQRLPEYIYRRRADGRVNYREKIPADVIVVGGIHAACGAGSALDSNGEHGLITLIFRNKAEPGQAWYLMTCAHVAGDVQRSPPAYPELSCDASGADPFARTTLNSTARAGEIEYDIALARIDRGALPISELGIREKPFRLQSFLPPQRLQQGLDVDVVLRNYSTRGAVESLHATAAVRYGSQTFRVHNLFGLNVAAARGDSGGLVCRKTEAVGIVVAASPEGWLWFQPLWPALEHLKALSTVPISVFNP